MVSKGRPKKTSTRSGSATTNKTSKRNMKVSDNSNMIELTVDTKDVNVKTSEIIKGDSSEHKIEFSDELTLTNEPEIAFKTDTSDTRIDESELAPVELDETVTIIDKEPETLPDKEMVDKLSSDCTVVIDNHETYFERLYAKEQALKSNEPERTFTEGMMPEIIDTYEVQKAKKVSSKRKSKKAKGPEIVPSETIVEDTKLSNGMCQYYVNTLYIVDSSNNTKYMQGSIITLPSDFEELKNTSKVFANACKNGRLIKCEDLTKKVEREEQVYDIRNRRWVKEGTPEYEEYLAYNKKKQEKIDKARAKKVEEERKRLGLE